MGASKVMGDPQSPWVSILNGSTDLDDLEVPPILGNLQIRNTTGTFLGVNPPTLICSEVVLRLQTYRKYEGTGTYFHPPSSWTTCFMGPQRGSMLNQTV